MKNNLVVHDCNNVFDEEEWLGAEEITGICEGEKNSCMS